MQIRPLLLIYCLKYELSLLNISEQSTGKGTGYEANTISRSYAFLPEINSKERTS